MIDLFIASPDKKIFEGEVKRLILPTASGAITVLNGHEPIMSIIDAGEIVYYDNGTPKHVAAYHGVVNVENNKGKTRVSILLENTENVHELDLERAKIAHDRVLVAMKEKDNEELDLNGNLLRELNRIKIARKHLR